MYEKRMPIAEDKIPDRKDPSRPIMDMAAELEALPDSPDQEGARQELIKDILDNVIEQGKRAGGEFFNDIAALYKQHKQSTYIVRRENPLRVFDLIANGRPIELKPDPALRGEYANSAVWSYNNPEGMNTAMLEGNSPSRVRDVATIIGIEESGDLTVKDIPENEKNRFDIDRGSARIAEGTIDPEKVRLLVIRAASDVLPASIVDNLSEAERDAIDNYLDQKYSKPERNGSAPSAPLKKPDILRGFSFPNGIKPPVPEKGSEQ
jgi:hypothetical protein